jgi:RNA polymerase sigma-70 factor (ECF subfamily)
LTDQELIQGFLNGGKQEYKQVVSWVTEVVRSKLWAERVAADDVIADTTMKLLLNLRDECFRLESSLKTYVQRIALYTLVDASRRVKNLEPFDDDEPHAQTSNPHSLMEDDEKQRLFQRVVGLLPEKCRQLWVMAFDNDLRSSEIAKKLGSSEGSVRTSLSRCKDQAAEILKRIS